MFLFRLRLSALHYNENSDRLQRVTVDGRPRYSIKYPKSIWLIKSLNSELASTKLVPLFDIISWGSPLRLVIQKKDITK